MDDGFKRLVIKLFVLLALVFIILTNFYISTNELKNMHAAALRPVAHILVISFIFYVFSTNRIEKIQLFKRDLKTDAVIGLVAAVFLGARFFFPLLPYRAFFTAIGFIALGIGVLGFSLCRHLAKEYNREIIYSIIVSIALWFALNLDTVVGSVLWKYF